MQLRRETLVAEHAELLAVIGDLLRHAARRPQPVADIAQLRWRLSRLLLAHLAKEDRLLHPMLQRGGDPVAAALSHRFEEEMGGLSDGFKAYMQDWDAQRIAADPGGFETATRSLATALSDRIRREETQLYRHIPTPKVDAGA
ncbi:hemerythrin domain-containing protein [Sphingomonas sp. 2R-10]|uniref:hemerythrin domain-containing protein n=1 Tax=Sphingomonas sp. 2R-10 TaxID=3045148 RepID=UPI0013DE7060|nr:hemerythrin domain-containing protein [Sphingomonas sp. 2R-10]MDJ0278338.1 hemerythrin domain-containing protein [Sphingomonas sp. 2R-10]